MDWKHALDLQHDTAKYYRSDHGIDIGSAFYVGLLKNYPVNTQGKIYLQMLQCLHQADTIFVTSDMLHLAMQAGHDLDDEVRFDIKSLLSRRGFMLFEEKIVGVDIREQAIVINAIAWEKTLHNDPDSDEIHDMVGLYFFTDPYDMDDAVNKIVTQEWMQSGEPVPPLVVSHYYPLVDGHRPPKKSTEPGYAIVAELTRLFMAIMYLSHQTIGEPMQLRPDRAARKRAQREWNQHDPLITVITLRRKSVKKDEEENGKVEWSRRWLVRGFWRKQWYPSLGIHQPVYIHEYIKGPENKPFIPPSGRVFNFRR